MTEWLRRALPALRSIAPFPSGIGATEQKNAPFPPLWEGGIESGLGLQAYGFRPRASGLGLQIAADILLDGVPVAIGGQQDGLPIV